ncbi:chemotaxis protein CheA [Priestia filamentosa]|uniref:chemotaxis protein CheW n=1 Tax=Priestia filamentosa TaxID=1402861 RepID=UPI00397E43A1
MEIYELVNLFIYELEEELGEYSSTSLEIENTPEFIPLIDDLYINVHTIKGSSKSLLNNLKKEEFHISKTHVEQIANITHSFEDYLEFLKSKNALSENDVTLLFEFEKIMRDLKSRIEEEIEDSIEQSIIDNFLKYLHTQNIVGGISNLNSQQNNDSINRNFFTITLDCDQQYKHAYLSIIYREIEEKYDDVVFIPSKESLLKNEEFNSISIQINSSEEHTNIKQFIKQIENVDTVESIPYKHIPSTKNEEKGTDITEEPINNTITGFISSYLPNANTPEKKVQKSQTLRISTRRIDNVLKHTSKLVILNNKLDQFLIQNDFLTGTKKRKELEELFAEISSHVDYLQESVLEIRMTSFKQLFERFPKDIRALSIEYKKPIGFSYSGESTEIDKNILDELFDPFMHLIRNSVIHGIESPEERIKKGKPPKGSINIQAKHDKNRVIITINDDGKGIGLEALKKSAINKKILSSSEANSMSKNDLLELIFKSGVSTSETVTEYSGRGIGMEAVRKKLDAVNGSISVSSSEDIGTTITLILPLTTAIIEGMITKINGEYFTFPISQVDEVINIKKSEVRTSSDKKYFFLKDKEIPIIYSEEYFNMETKEKDPANPFLKIMIVRAHNYIVGLTIDEFLGQQSIVVKNMHPFVQSARGISSCNILGDGSISLIVDSNDLLQHLSKV